MLWLLPAVSGFMWREALTVIEPQCHAVVNSHCSHPLITKSHEGDAQPLHGDAILLGIELVRPLLL